MTKEEKDYKARWYSWRRACFYDLGNGCYRAKRIPTGWKDKGR